MISAGSEKQESKRNPQSYFSECATPIIQIERNNETSNYPRRLHYCGACIGRFFALAAASSATWFSCFFYWNYKRPVERRFSCLRRYQSNTLKNHLWNLPAAVSIKWRLVCIAGAKNGIQSLPVGIPDRHLSSSSAISRNALASAGFLGIRASRVRTCPGKLEIELEAELVSVISWEAAPIQHQRRMGPTNRVFI
jgi:hypothetical protein